MLAGASLGLRIDAADVDASIDDNNVDDAG